MRELIKLLPKENKPNYDREQALLNEIRKNNLSPEFWIEYNQLAYKSDAKILTEVERTRFQELVKMTRVRDLERIKLMLELSEIWGTSLDETRSLLSITSDKAKYALKNTFLKQN